MGQNITVRLVLDTRRRLKDNTYPVKIRVGFNRKAVFFKVNNDYFEGIIIQTSFTNSEFESIQKGKSKDYPNHRSFFQSIEQEYEKLALQLDSFSFSRFNKLLEDINNRIEEEVALTEIDALMLFDERIKVLLKNKQYSSSELYSAVRNNLEKFIAPKDKIFFKDINKTFLMDFEKWLPKNSKVKAISTIETYMKYIRIVYNIAIDRGIVNKDNYPFNNKQYIIPHITKDSEKNSD